MHMMNLQRPKQPDIVTDYLIVGAGVAGITLAERLIKAGKEVYVLGQPFESQLAKAGNIEDSELLSSDIVGLKYMEEKINAAKALGVQHKTSLVTKLIPGDPIIAETKFQKFFANQVIIATGAHQVRLGFPGEEQFFHNGISDCSVCDATLFRDEPVAVVGNHKYTVRSAKYLSNFGSKVTLLWLYPELPQEYAVQLNKFANIEVITGVTNLTARGSDIIEQVEFDTNGQPQILQLTALFVEGKPHPNTAFLPEIISKDEHGHVIVTNFQTSVKHIYAVGEAIKSELGYDKTVAQANQLADLLLG